MSRMRVFICTKNPKYGEGIVRYATSKSHSDIQFLQLTEITDKTEFHKTDVVVSEDSANLEHVKCRKIPLVRQREKEEESIFMYQDRENIYRQLIQMIGAQEEGEVPKVMCVFSPEGGDDKTLLALQRGVELGKTRRVLYVSLCGFPVFFRREISRAPQGAQLGVAQLFLCTRQAEFDQQLESLSFPMGSIDMMPPVEHYKDLLDFSREEVLRFMHHLQGQALYDVVILEAGQLFEYTFDLLSCAERVLVPKEPGVLAEVRRHVFREYCKREGKDEVWEHLEVVPVNFPRLESIEEVNRIFFGEESVDESGGAATKGKNTKSRFGAGVGRRGAG